jgi:integrase
LPPEEKRVLREETGKSQKNMPENQNKELETQKNEEKIFLAEVLPPDPAGGALGMLAWLKPGDPLYSAARRVAECIRNAKSEATRRAYAADWRDFSCWCQQNRLAFLPATPETVALYIAHLSKPEGNEKPRTVATITRRLSSINTMHKAARYRPPAKMDDPVLAETYHGICRLLGTRQQRKQPLTLDKIVRLLDAVRTTDLPVAGARDRALILVGFVGAFRRSELAAMRVEDLVRHRRGYTIRIPRSKTDQTGEGREVEILYGAQERTCPVLALENWFESGAIREGFVFRQVGLYGELRGGLSPAAVAEIVKRLVRRAHLETPENYGGHSLRAGFVTEASANGASDREIMRQTGHRSRAMIDRYARAEQRDRQSAVSKLGV